MESGIITNINGKTFKVYAGCKLRRIHNPYKTIKIGTILTVKRFNIKFKSVEFIETQNGSEYSLSYFEAAKINWKNILGDKIEIKHRR